VTSATLEMRTTLAASFLAIVAGGAAGHPKDAQTIIPLGWTRIDTPAFSFYAPADTHRIDPGGRPIDSLAETFASADFRLEYDYGLWSMRLGGYKADPRYVSQTVTIDGRPGLIITGPGLGDSTGRCSDYLTAIYVVDRKVRHGRAALAMEGCAQKPEGVGAIHALFMTIAFKH
jgi:hypothetical protein